ncbi:hypothetical protein C8Q76DRAFT_635756, partial [Earliella scabrosa]
ILVLATSADAERGFSRGRLTVSRLRHSLSDASIRATTLVGSWARIDGLIPKKAIIQKLDPQANPATFDAAPTASVSGSRVKNNGQGKGKGKGKEANASAAAEVIVVD